MTAVEILNIVFTHLTFSEAIIYIYSEPRLALLLLIIIIIYQTKLKHYIRIKNFTMISIKYLYMYVCVVCRKLFQRALLFMYIIQYNNFLLSSPFRTCKNINKAIC